MYLSRLPDPCLPEVAYQRPASDKSVGAAQPGLDVIRSSRILGRIGEKDPLTLFQDLEPDVGEVKAEQDVSRA